MVQIFLPHTKCTMNYLAFQLKGGTLIFIWVKVCSLHAPYKSNLHAPDTQTVSILHPELTSHSFV